MVSFSEFFFIEIILIGLMLFSHGVAVVIDLFIYLFIYLLTKHQYMYNQQKYNYINLRKKTQKKANLKVTLTSKL